MKVLFVNGSRGEWGYIRPVIDKLVSAGDSYTICATNMLLLDKHGSLVDEIERDGYSVGFKIYMSLEGSTHFSMAKSVGVFTQSMVDVLLSYQPDWLILAGDRAEMFAAATAAAYCYIPCAHIQAGERSGNIDGVIRHAIGRLAHLHFASNSEAASRLLKTGEQDFRVCEVGAPQIDDLEEMAGSVDWGEIKHAFGFDLSQTEFILGVFHPVTETLDDIRSQTTVFMRALREAGPPIVLIAPNNDAGGEQVVNIVKEMRRSDMFLVSNLPRAKFAFLLKNCCCIVGNSSSGLLEAPTFKTPSVNIGRRQDLRVRAPNVIDVPEMDLEKIGLAIELARSDAFNSGLASIRNPYGNGDASEKIITCLKEMRKHPDLLVKQLTF